MAALIESVYEDAERKTEFDSSEGEEVSDLQSMLKIGYTHAKKAAGKDIILVIGPTRVGKSTTIAYLMGAPLLRSRVLGRERFSLFHEYEHYSLALMTPDLRSKQLEQGKIYIEKVGDALKYSAIYDDKIISDTITIEQLPSLAGKLLDPLNLVTINPLLNDILQIMAQRCHTRKYPAIGHGAPACTFYPEIYESCDGNVYCDCAGFFDNCRSNEEKVVMSISMEMIVKFAKSVRVLALVPYNYLGDNAKDFFELVELLNKMFKRDMVNITKSIMWVITKTPDDISIDDLDMQIHDSKNGLLGVINNCINSAAAEIYRIWKICGEGRLPIELIVNSLSKIPIYGEKIKEYLENNKKFCRQNAIVGSIHKRDNLFLLDLQRDSTRTVLLEQPHRMRSIPRCEFNCDVYDDSRLRFYSQADLMLQKIILLFKQNAQLGEEIRSDMQRMETIKGRIVQINQIDSTATDDGDALLQQQRHDDIFVVEQKKTLICQKKRFMEDELSSLDNDEEVIIVSQPYKEKIPGWILIKSFSWCSKPLEFNTYCPISRVEEHYKKAEATLEPIKGVHREDNGRYAKKYETNRGYDADITITLFTKSSLLPTNKRRIEFLKTEMSKLNEQIQSLDRTLQDLKSAKISSIREEQARYQQSLTELTEHLRVKQFELDTVRAQIQKYKSTIEMICDWTTMCTDWKSAFRTEFEVLYTQYKRENPGFSSCSSFVFDSSAVAAASASSSLCCFVSTEREPSSVVRQDRIIRISGYTLCDVPTDGNCFYHAVVDQMALLNHPFLNDTPLGTSHSDRLRLHIEEREFRDGQWADHPEIERLIQELNIIVAIVDARAVANGFVYHYRDSNNIVTYTNNLTQLPHGIPMIRLAYTGTHYLSVRSAPGESDTIGMSSDSSDRRDGPAAAAASASSSSPAPILHLARPAPAKDREDRDRTATLTSGSSATNGFRKRKSPDDGSSLEPSGKRVRLSK